MFYLKQTGNQTSGSLATNRDTLLAACNTHC